MSRSSSAIRPEKARGLWVPACGIARAVAVITHEEFLDTGTLDANMARVARVASA